MRTPSLPCAFACLASLWAPGSAIAQELLELTPLAEITPVAPAPSLGVAMAIDGTLCAASDVEGRVHLYEVGSGTPQLVDTLFGPQGSGFGVALDLSNDRLVVGAPAAGPDAAGAVYFYRRHSNGRWEVEQMLVGETPGGRFGQSVNWNFGRLAVGVPGHAGLAGEVHIFDPVGAYFERTQVLISSNSVPGDSLGESLAWEESLLVAGAPFSDIGFFDAGVVYVFREGAVTLFEETRLTPTDPVKHGMFGASVATDGLQVAVGAPGGRAGNLRTGRAYVFVNGFAGWFQLTDLEPELARPRDFFGSSIVMRSGMIGVGSLGDDTPQGSGTGSVTFFSDAAGTWSRTVASTPASAQANSWSGAAMHLNGRSLAVSAPGQNGGSGSVFVFAARDRVGTAYCGPAVDHSGGVGARVFAYGSQRRDAGLLGLKAVDLPASTFGLFLVADQTALQPGFMGGQGTLCLGSPFGMFVDQVQKGGSQGILQSEVDWDVLPFFVSGMVGQTYSFQAWFRDSNPGPTTNFSDAVSISLQ